MAACLRGDRRVRALARDRGGASSSSSGCTSATTSSWSDSDAARTNPFKRWKLTEEDWRNRARNRDYDRAAEELFARTDHELAPWDVVAAEQKRYARIAVLERLNERIEEGMRRFDMAIPDRDPDRPSTSPMTRGRRDRRVKTKL